MHIIEIHEHMLATERCDRCGAQARVEVKADAWPTALLLCAHHFERNKEGLAKVPDLKIADHRPALLVQEGAQRDAAAAPK